MELSNLVRPGRLTVAAGVGALGILGLVAGAGCRDSAAGGRPHDAAVEAAVDLVPKLPPPDADCPADAAGGKGCPVNFCGAPKAVSALAAGETAQLGADSICTPGDVCVPDGPTAAGNALQLRCVHPFSPARAFGDSCAMGAGATNRCSDDALCIAAAAAPGQLFCSALCSSDRDCPAGGYCLEYKTPLPGGSYVNLGYCTPQSKIAGTSCAREADCPAGQGCLAAGARTNLLTCQPGGTKSVGEKCNKGSDCRSGQCYDRAFHADVPPDSYCSAICGKNSDCGADQQCARIVVGNNGTPADPRDDVVVGLCQSLFVPSTATACQKDADCTTGGADTCSKKYGLCYKAGAPSGAACTADEGCELGAVCSMDARFPGGYCQTFGCAPGAAPGSADGCPGANATCVQRGTDEPLYACYEGCAQSGDCSRFKQNYVCEAAATGGADAGADAATDAATSDASSASDAPPVSDGAAGDGAEAGGGGALPSICIYNQGV